MDLNKIGKFISEERKKKNYTQKQLADILNVSDRTISKWECGNYMPPIECLSMLSDIYKISINEMLVGERVCNEEFTEIAERNITSTLKELEKENQIFEKRMLCILAITTILTIIIVFLLPMKGIKDIIVLVLVIAVAFIANTLTMVALATKKENLKE